jgi:uncharacterized protein YkwD
MDIYRLGLFLSLALAAATFAAAQPQQNHPSQYAGAANLQPQAEQLFALANQTRAESGAGRLEWDPALAAAALEHCRRMAVEGPIAHRYDGELDVSARAAQAGSHFSLIEENIAVGPSPAAIHDQWMHSPGHRSNLLNPEVDSIGVAVLSVHGSLYAVADYARAVPSLTASQVEKRVAEQIRVSGVSILSDPDQARAACVSNRGVPGASSGMQPGFVMRWQGSDLTQLPQPLTARLASGKYRHAAVGSCPPQGAQSSFTAYRLAVLLY